MASEYSAKKDSNSQLLQELEELSQTLYPNHTPAATNRRNASLSIPRTSLPSFDDLRPPAKHSQWGRRMSLSPWRSRPKFDGDGDEDSGEEKKTPEEAGSAFLSPPDMPDKKGIWNWKPIRALSHIGMQKVSCLFSVEVIAVQGLPPSMNGLRLSVCVRKKETREGSVHTMPSRVSLGVADFEEMLFFRCHVYCSHGDKKSNQIMKFDPRPFWIYVFAVDANELDLGRSSVDLSRLIQESIAKSQQGARVRQWDAKFNLAGKAKGGELVIKLGFQIMEEGGVDIYSDTQTSKSGKKGGTSSSNRRHSKASFSVPSPKMTTGAETFTPSLAKPIVDLHGIDDLNLDDHGAVPVWTAPIQKPVEKTEDDIPDFEVVDKGVEILDAVGEESEENTEEKSTSSEVVKEVVHDPLHFTRLSELDSIAQQIKALEAMMKDVKHSDGSYSFKLNSEEDAVTKEFLQMLEDEDDSNAYKFSHSAIRYLQLEDDNKESRDYVSDLGKGLGCVIQTRNGGFLASMDPFDAVIRDKETPKLAMQLSKPIVFSVDGLKNEFEVFQSMVALGVEELGGLVTTAMPMDELLGKTAEQIAFEGIASAIIQGRNKEGATSRAARSIAAVRTMSTAMSGGRKERVTTGIWNVSDSPVAIEDILAFSLQKIESMAVEALKIQAELSDEEPPFDVSPKSRATDTPLSSAVSLEEWDGASASIALMVILQLRDPVRRYETVGGPLLAIINAGKMTGGDEEGSKYRVSSLHVGGVTAKRGEKTGVWDSEKQRLTAMQWLVVNGLSKGGRRGKQTTSSKGKDTLWSISSRVMAGMWLKPIRNPDVKFA